MVYVRSLAASAQTLIIMDPCVKQVNFLEELHPDLFLTEAYFPLQY